MLILTRHVGESFRIGDDITITVVSARSKQVRLGIDAPRDVEVHRLENIEGPSGNRGEEPGP